MKRVGDIYGKIIDIDNLREADRKASRGRHHKHAVRKHYERQEEELIKLRGTLEEMSYRTSEYHVFTIHEKKDREVHSLPYFPDRILHHAIMSIVEPIWHRTFIRDTYGSIPRRGIHGAMKRMKEFISKGRDADRLYCLKIDIRKFFPNINHSKLKEIVRKKIKDEKFLSLIDEIIDSADGLPIGNYTSQYLSNLYLAYFDHWVKEELRVKYYIRYVDDMVFLSDSKEELRRILEEVRKYLKEKLFLDLNGKEQIFPVADNRYDRKGRGIDFLGFVFYRKQTLIRKSIKKNFCRKAAKIGKIEGMDSKIYKKELASWFGWAKYSNSRNLIKKIIKTEINESLLRQKTFGR